jgi:hypothetical protein
MARGHGGARPGAGRKSKTTAERQDSNLSIALAKADPEAVEGMVASMIAEAQGGNVKAFLALAPYLFGSPAQRHEVAGADGGPIVFSLHLGDAEPTG